MKYVKKCKTCDAMFETSKSNKQYCNAYCQVVRRNKTQVKMLRWQTLLERHHEVN